MDKFQVVDEKDLQVIEGGIEPISIIFWPKVLLHLAHLGLVTHLVQIWLVVGVR